MKKGGVENTMRSYSPSTITHVNGVTVKVLSLILLVSLPILYVHDNPKLRAAEINSVISSDKLPHAPSASHPL